MLDVTNTHYRRYAGFVDEILRRLTPAGTAKKKYEDFYSSHLRRSVYQEFRRYDVVSARSIICFANAATLHALDRAELFIRWGETLFDQSLYPSRIAEQNRWIEIFNQSGDLQGIDHMTRPTMSFAQLIRRWSLQAHNRRRKDPEIRQLAKHLKMTERGLQKALVSGSLPASKFHRLCEKLELVRDQKAFASRLFLEAKLGQALLGFDLDELNARFSPLVHTRTLACLLGEQTFLESSEPFTVRSYLLPPQTSAKALSETDPSKLIVN